MKSEYYVKLKSKALNIVLKCLAFCFSSLSLILHCFQSILSGMLSNIGEDNTSL